MKMSLEELGKIARQIRGLRNQESYHLRIADAIEKHDPSTPSARFDIDFHRKTADAARVSADRLQRRLDESEF